MCSSPEATVRLYTTQNERNMVLHSIHISFPRNELNVVNKYPSKKIQRKILSICNLSSCRCQFVFRYIFFNLRENW